MNARHAAAFAAFGLVLAACSLLSGCGFTPLYAEAGVTPALTHIEVDAPKGRTAFLLSQSLDDALGRDHESPATYRLKISVAERSFSRGLTLNNVAERYESHLRVTYELIDLATGKTVKSAVEPIEITYAATDQPYAGLSAEQDADQRAAEQAAQRIGIDLAAYFANPSKP